MSARHTTRSDWRHNRLSGVQIIYQRCSDVVMVAVAKFAIAVLEMTQRSTSLEALVKISRETLV